MASSIEVIQHEEPSSYAFIDFVGPYFDSSAPYERFMNTVDATTIGNNPLQFLAIRLDDPDTTPASSLRSRVGIFLRDHPGLVARASMNAIPPGKYVRMKVHCLPTDLPQHWRFLYEVWLPHSGERARAMAGYEVYPEDPRAHPGEAIPIELYIALA